MSMFIPPPRPQRTTRQSVPDADEETVEEPRTEEYDDEIEEHATELQPGRTRSGQSRTYEDFLDEDEDEPKYPTPGTDHVYSKRVLDICVHLQTMEAAEFVRTAANYDTYVGSPRALERLDHATFDDRGRFWVKNSNGDVEELRWTYAGRGRTAFGFTNGKTGNAFPAQWASEATRPSTITIETTPANSSMRRKRAVEGKREYLCNVFSNAQAPPSWSMACSLPPVNDIAKRHLEEAIGAFSTRIKVLKASALAAKWTWVEPRLGGGVMWPRLERSLFVKAGESADPGRESGVTADHDLLRLVGEDQGYRYNNVPEVVLLDTRDYDQWKVDWHAVHDVTSTACWQVGFFVRAYTSTSTKKLGFALVLDTLVAHGKLPAPSITSPTPAKRSVDYFAGYDRPDKRARPA